MAAFLSLGLSAPALAQTTNGQDVAQDEGGEMAQRMGIPTAEDATQRECQAWLDQLGVTINAAETGGDILHDILQQAEQRRDEIAQACDDGDYYEAITMAAETIETIDGQADPQAGN